MHSGPTLRLPGHPVVQTRDPDEARAWLNARGIGLDVAARDARQFSMCLNSVSLPNGAVTFSYVYYGAPVSVTTTEANHDYWVLPPICGALEGGTGKSEAAFGPDRAFVMSPLRSSRVRSQERSARLSLRLTGTALNSAARGIAWRAAERSPRINDGVEARRGIRPQHHRVCESLLPITNLAAQC